MKSLPWGAAILACAAMAPAAAAQEPSHVEIARAVLAAFRERYASFAERALWLNAAVASPRPREGSDHRQCGIGADDVVIVISRPRHDRGAWQVRVIALHSLREGRIWTGFTSEATLESTPTGWVVTALRGVSVY